MSSRSPFPIRIAAWLFALALSGFAQAETPSDWSGFYIGGNVGGNWTKYSGHGFSDSLNTLPLPGPNTLLIASTPGFDSTSAAFLGGGQAGYNLQFGRFVFGFEGDFDGTASSATKSIFVPAPLGDSGFTAQRKFESNWMASTRVRAGFSYDRLLFYATGGGAFTDVDVHAIDLYPPRGLSVSSDSSKTLVGWTAGLGAEWEVRKGVSIGLEYRHSGFGRETYGMSSIAPVLATESTSVAPSNDQVTFRVNLLLNGLFGH